MKSKKRNDEKIMNAEKPNILPPISISNAIAIAIAVLFTASPALRGESMMSSGMVAGERPKAENKAAVKPATRIGTPSKTEAKTGEAAKAPAKPALNLTPTQEDKLLALLNRGTAVELTAISGIAAMRAEAIVGARPFQNVHEVMLVPGVGDATFKNILEHGKTLTQPAPKSSKS
jgi:DNA uptake protein ComE-like DNA-binding protein